MIKNIVMPKLGLTASEGRIVEWFYAEGAQVEKEAPLFVVETEKANVEIECPVSGVLLKALPAGGEPILIGKVIGFIATAGETFVPAELLAASELAPGEQIFSSDPTPPAAQTAPPLAVPPSPAGAGDREKTASPLARKLALEKGLDLSKISGTGPSGRITKEDVLAAAEQAQTAQPPAPQETMMGLAGTLLEPSRFDAISAQRLTVSKQTIPHWYITYEVDVTDLLELRQRLLGALQSADAPRLTVTDLLVKAVALTLQEHPKLNASFEAGKICLYDEINIAVAIDTPHGLAAPVIRQAGQMPLREISATLERLTERAKAMQLTDVDVSNGTFTISNLGMLGVSSFAAIINPPQAAILAVSAIVKRPLVVDDATAIRSVLSLTLAADHRVVDGATAARFMRRLKELLENAYILVS